MLKHLRRHISATSLVKSLEGGWGSFFTLLKILFKRFVKLSFALFIAVGVQSGDSTLINHCQEQN